MKIIIAEKPSVAREIARIVGATRRKEGYFEGGGYAVTWAFGHHVQLAMPDGYGIRGIVRDNLPVIPGTFTLILRQEKTEKGYKPDSGVVSQISFFYRAFSFFFGTKPATIGRWSRDHRAVVTWPSGGGHWEYPRKNWI